MATCRCWWHFARLAQGPQANQVYFRQAHPAAAAGPATVAVRLPPGRYRCTACRVGYGHNDAYSQYLAWGRPAALTPAQEASLRALNHDAPARQTTVQVGPGGLTQAFDMRENDVVLLKISRAG